MKKMIYCLFMLFLINSFGCIQGMGAFFRKYFPQLTGTPRSGQRVRYFSSPLRTSDTSQTSSQSLVTSVSKIPSQAPTTKGWLSNAVSSIRAYFDPEGARIAEENARKEEYKRRFDEAVMNFKKTIAHSPYYVYMVNSINALRTVGKTPEEVSRLEPIDWNEVVMTSGYHNPDTVVSDVLRKQLENTINSTTCETIEDIQKLYDAYLAYTYLMPNLLSRQDLDRDPISQSIKNIMEKYWKNHILSITKDNLARLSLEEQLATSDPVIQYFNTPEADRISFVAQLKKEDKDILMEAKEKGINTDHQFTILAMSAREKINRHRQWIEKKIKTITDNFYREVDKRFKPREDVKIS